MCQLTEIGDKCIKYNLMHLPQLVFEVTDICNLRCKYCGYAGLYEGYDKRENSRFPFQKAKLIIDYLHDLWKENYNEGCATTMTIGFYGGEPLLNVSFIEQTINYLESLEPVGKKFFYNMTTNAMLLDKYMDFLVEKEFRLLISIDGDKEGQGYRVDASENNSFDRVFANICLLRDRYPDYFKKFVMFNSVLHNKNSVERTFHFIKENFGKEPTISPLNNAGIRKDKIEEFNRTYRNYSESIQEAKNCEALKNEMFIKSPENSKLLDYIYYESGNVFFNYNSLLANQELWPTSPTGTCSPFSKKMFITVKGRILQCERINHEFALGQITNNAVELDWRNIAEQHNKYVFKYANQCKHCANKRTCTQCVYQIDDIQDKDTKCTSFYTEFQKNREQEKCLKYLTEHSELYERLLRDVVIRG